jgi:hypothetical protein
MADVKKRYGEITRVAKEDLRRAADVTRASKGSYGHSEEERIFSTFKKRAREDYRTLSSSTSSTINRR